MRIGYTLPASVFSASYIVRHLIALLLWLPFNTVITASYVYCLDIMRTVSQCPFCVVSAVKTMRKHLVILVFVRSRA